MTDNSLSITGRSYPENAVGFYKSLMDRLNEIESFDDFTVDLNFEYINTSSSKALIYILKNIADKTKNEVVVTWYVEDGDDGMEDLSEHFGAILNNVKLTKINY